MEKKESFLKRYWLIVLTGLIVGAAAVLLTAYGNPQNMGFCIACFLRDIAGALKLQTAGLTAETGTGIVQYIRPEIIGLVLGAFALSLVRKEFRPVGGSSPMTRFVIAVFVMIGALVFLGCPLRMVIRIGGGDLNAVVGLVGFIAGIFVGTIALKKGFSLKRNYAEPCIDGAWMPVLMVILLVLAGLAPALFAQSTEGPGSMHAPFWIALIVALVLVLVFSFFFRIIQVDGSSMVPTLVNGDKLIVWGAGYTPQRGDVVIVDSYTSYGKPLVKRVIAKGGDTVSIDYATGTVAVNGEVLQEDYIAEPTYLGYDVTFPYTVPEGTVFVMGDNRNQSLDSRSTYVGCIDERDILGKVLVCFMPFTDFGVVK